MRKFVLITTALLLSACNFQLSTFQIRLSAVLAQPTTVRNAAKSVFTLTTFRADGSLLASSHGVFIGQQGEAISDLTSFLGAARAVVVDANGRQMEVTRMLGVNDIYDVARFRVDGKTTPAPVATTVAQTSAQAWLLPYAVDKKGTAAPVATTIKSTETFMDSYGYYIFDLNVPENTASCPFVDAQGQVLGLLQLTNSGDNVHAVSALYVGSLQINALQLNDATMSRIGIPAALPNGADQAQLALIISGSDAIKHAAIVNDFIQQYPKLPDGYQARAQMEVNAGQFEAAARDMETVISNSEKKDEAHYAYGQLIYNKLLYTPQQPYAPWTFDRAISEARKAYEINPQPVYRHLEAQIIFSKGEYQQAYDMFMELTQTSLRSPELFYEAAHSLQLLHPQDTAHIALIDSAIIACDSINQVNPAPYVLARAQAYEAVGQYRRAVGDYNIYAYIMRPQLGAAFYYMREQCEVKAKLWQQAIVDINTAIELDKQQALYYAEKANLLLRVNMAEQAVDIARQCIALAPDYSDGYLILGLAQVQLQQKEEGLQNLRKAHQLGNEQAQPLIEKYQ